MKKLIVLCVCGLMSIFLLLGCSDNSQSSDTPDPAPAEDPEGTTPDEGTADEDPEGEATDPAEEEPEEEATPERGYEKTTPEVAQTMMQTEEYILFDPRTPQEYQTRRLEGAISIPQEEIEARVETEIPDKEALIFVYGRPAQTEPACTLLAELGYTNVHDIGSVMDNGPFPVVNG